MIPPIIACETAVFRAELTGRRAIDRGGNKRPALYRRIHDLVARIPAGRVVSYGDIARFVGCAPRVAGHAMAALEPDSPVPWHRVVNSRGGISPRAGGDGADTQRRLLEAEGVVFDRRGRLDLAALAWPGPNPVEQPWPAECPSPVERPCPVERPGLAQRS